MARAPSPSGPDR